jgi:CDP-diglyceride synthetase
METQEVNQSKPIAVKFGIICGIVSILYATIINITGNQANKTLSWFGLVIIVTTLVFAFRTFKNSNNGFMTLKEGFGIGAIISIISTLLSVIYTYIYTKFIDPDYFEVIKELQQDELAKQGIPDEQIEQSMKIIEKFMTPEIISVTALVTSIIGGLIISVIVAAIMKKESTQF